MNTVIFCLILALGSADDLPQNGDEKEADCGFNLFCYINDSLLDMMNKLFIMFSLDSNFTEVSKVKLLLNMHDNLRNIAENNYKIYQDIINTIKVNYDNKTVKPLFNLTEAIEEFFHEQRREFLIYNKTEVNLTHHQNKGIIVKEVSCSLEINETAVNSIEFLSDFLEKVDKLSFQDLLQSTQKLINESSDSRSGHTKHKSKNRVGKIIKTFNLKPWNYSAIAFCDNFEGNKTSPGPANSSEDNDTRRIFKGKKTKIKRFPFTASFHMTGEFLCAGSIISKNMILSAASCLQIPYNYKSLQDNPNYLTVRIGSDYVNKMGDLVPVIGIILHPAYDPVNLQNNLAIAKTERPIIFQRRNKKIRRIEFKRKTNTFLEEAGVVIMPGWGDKNKYDTQSYGDPISFAHLKVYPLQECKEIYSARYVTEMHFCAGFKQVGTGACNRDVGGPGIVGSILVGVVSFGPPVCGTPDTPTVFTKLSYYTAWIDDVITKDQAEDAGPTTLPPVLRERELLEVVVNELPIVSTHSTLTTKEVPKKLQILKKLFKELIRTGTIDVNELLFNNDRNAESNKEPNGGSVESSLAAVNLNVDITKTREGNGMMMKDHTGVYSSTKGQQETEQIIHDKRFSVDPPIGLQEGQVGRSIGSDNYETQVINFEPDINSEEGLSIEYMPRAKLQTQSSKKRPLPSVVIQNVRNLRNINKKNLKRKKHRNHKIVKERRVKKADAATDVVPFEIDEDLNPVITTISSSKVYMKTREDSNSIEKATTIKTYDADDIGGANIEFEIIAGAGPSDEEVKEANTAKSLLEYVNLK